MTPRSDSHHDDVLRFWDDDHPREEREAFLDELDVDPVLRQALREEAMLQDGALKTAIPHFAHAAPRESFWRRIGVPAAAAAALVAGAFFAGRFTLQESTAPVQPSPLAVEARLQNTSDTPVDVKVANALVRAYPGAQGQRTSNGLRLDSGTVEVDTDTDSDVLLGDLGCVRVNGSMWLSFSAGRPGVLPPRATLRILRGHATVLPRRGDPIPLKPGTLSVIDQGGARPLDHIIERLAALSQEEGSATFSRAELDELIGIFQEERTTQEAELASLQQQLQSLSLELEASKGQASIADLVEALARHDSSPSASRRRGFWWGMARHLVDLAKSRGQEETVITEVQGRLLAESSTARERMRAMYLLGEVGTDPARTVIKKHLDDEDAMVRASAVYAIAKRPSEAERSLLRRWFESDKNMDVRISAAGGLMSLGAEPDVLQWLMGQYSQLPNHRERDRQRIMARVMKAPFASVAPFLVAVCVDSHESPRQQSELLYLARHVAESGSRDARNVLEFVAEAAPDVYIRHKARRLLDDLKD